MWGLQQAESLMESNMSDDLSLLKCMIRNIEPSNSKIVEKLECMEQLKKGDFRDLMRFKQTLNYSSPVDVLFDLFTDLYRMSTAESISSNQQQLVLHKLNTPAIQDLLTPNLLQSMKDFIPNANLHPFLTMLAAIITPQLKDLFLKSLLDYLSSVRE